MSLTQEGGIRKAELGARKGDRANKLWAGHSVWLEELRGMGGPR